ncbi:hypothetical protein ACFVMC_19860 [Nocardia sp. NPDC127579]|uniref:hypothetical protein n=1 Tax=Nocardia sp. NPDC127579 TaxID=3345402 RepID=UPI00363E054C
MDTGPLILGLLCAAPFVLAAVLIPVQLAAERKRREARMRWAHLHGWRYEERPRTMWTTRMPGANARGVRWMVTGMVRDRWVSVAHYYYQTSSTDSNGSTSTTTHNFIAAVVQLRTPHPPIGVVTRGLLSQMGRSLFGDKPTATGNPVFDSRFRVIARDPYWAHQLIGRPLIDAHLANLVPQWTIDGNQLLAHYPGKLVHPEAMGPYVDPLLRVADLLGTGIEPWVMVPPRN